MLYAQGLTITAIARQMEVSRSVVSKWIIPARRGKYVRWTDKETEILRLGRYVGHSYARLARRLNCSVTAARIALCRHRKKLKSDLRRRIVIRILATALKSGATGHEAIQSARKMDIFRFEPLLKEVPDV